MGHRVEHPGDQGDRRHQAAEDRARPVNPEMAAPPEEERGHGQQQAGGVDLERQPDPQHVQEGGPEPGPLALDESAPQVDGAEQVEVVRVPEERGEVELPGIQPVEEGQQHPLVGGEDALERAVQDQVGGDVEEEDEGARRPVVPPEEERQPHQQAGDRTRLLASRGHGVAVGDPRPLGRQEPAAGEEVELVPRHLAADEHADRDQEPEGEERPDDAGRGGRREPGGSGRDHGSAG